MPRNNKGQRARHARQTNTFFDQLPETSPSTNSQQLTHSNTSSATFPLEDNEAAFTAVVEQIIQHQEANVRKVAFSAAKQIYQAEKSGSNVFRGFFTTAFLYVHKVTGKREWRVDEEIINLIAAGYYDGTIKELYASRNPTTNKQEIQAPFAGPVDLDEAGVIEVIRKYFIRLADARSSCLHEEVDFTSEEDERVRFFIHLGYIAVRAFIRNKESVEFHAGPLDAYILARESAMADRENLFIPTPLKESYNPVVSGLEKAKAKTAKVAKAKEMENNTEITEGEIEANKKNGDTNTATAAAAAATATGKKTKSTATNGAAAAVTEDPLAAMTAATQALSMYGAHPPAGLGDMLGIDTRSRGLRLPAASATYYDGFTNADGPPTSGVDPAPVVPKRSGRRVRHVPFLTRADAAAINSATTDAAAEDTATEAATPTARAGQAGSARADTSAGNRRARTTNATAFTNDDTASAAGASTGNGAGRATTPREPAAQRRAKAQIHREIEALLMMNFPNAEARRAAYAQAHQRILRSETIRAARGEQPLRATATRATQAALMEGRDDALNAVREQRRAERLAEASAMRAQGLGTEANARAREQGHNFDIGGMPGYLGELEAMQVQALQRRMETVRAGRAAAIGRARARAEQIEREAEEEAEANVAAAEERVRKEFEEEKKVKAEKK